MNEKLEAAIAYLRSRNKYVVDQSCNFTPTKAVMTDVSETIRAYRAAVEKVPPMYVLRGKKK
jgi:hypothetical protein